MYVSLLACLSHVELQGVDCAVAAPKYDVCMRGSPLRIHVATGNGSLSGHLQAFLQRNGTQPD